MSAAVEFVMNMTVTNGSVTRLQNGNGFKNTCTERQRKRALARTIDLD